MANSTPYFFNLSFYFHDPWHYLGWFHSVEEAYSYFEKLHGKMNVTIVEGKYFRVDDGVIHEI